ncbi:centrosomal protein of 85 kDa-like [Penaeus chinensis]|uniref:centrosomal protein of 85 kDa-like n=1 Tax=Penaeus chinensis TaxID=139456 RepID=UPI001FB6D724|nr:centrosomal protein of 85 kDa-like [Penaeus chinensis]
MEREIAVPAFVHKHQSPSPHFSSPHLLGLQSGTAVTPAKGLARSPRTGSPIPSLSHTPHASPSSRDLELHSLRNQVQEIQDKLNGDIVSSTEYQQLFYEKVKLEETLGATEHELQQLQTAYNDLETNAALTERNLNSELRDMKEKYQVKTEKHKATLEELTRLTDYLRDLPTLDEHQQLQQQLARKSAQSTHLSRKIDHLTQKLAELAARESEQEARIEVLSHENEDLALKLGLTEKILKDLESQKAAAHEEGQHSKEDLLWRLDQVTKELDSAKKLLSYRKQKLESQQKEILIQEKKHNAKMQAEVELGEKLKEQVWDMEKELEDCKQREEKTKNSLAKATEKQIRTEERLEVTLSQIRSQHQTSSTVVSLIAHLNSAVLQLRDLVTVSQQISQGTLPDLTVLLNFKDPEVADQGGMLTADDLQERLSDVRGLISELDRIRTALQEEHANQLASNVSCAQM